MRGTQLPPTTVKRNVGKCPACRGYLFAEVDLSVHVGEPDFTLSGEPTAHVCVKAVAMRLSHECRTDESEADRG